jgi:DNA-binding NarL/FixJ family response regulator
MAPSANSPRAAATERPVPPLVVVDGVEDHRLALAGVARAGWRVVAIDELPPRTWELGAMGLACACTLEAPADAERALVAAARGTGLVAHSLLDRKALARFVDDLRRFGPVDVGSPRSESARADALSPDQSRALEIVAGGGSLADVATTLHCSQRTAGRRVAAAREALGARTTAEAIRKLER